MELNLETVRQILLLSSILGGFALAAVVQLAAGATRSRVTTFAMSALLISAASLLLAVWAGVLLHADNISTGNQAFVAQFLATLCLFGGLMFMIGIVAVARLYSRIMAIVATVVAVIFVVVGVTMTVAGLN